MNIPPDKTTFIVLACALNGPFLAVAPSQYDLAVTGADDPAHLTKGPYTGTASLKLTAPDGTVQVINPGDEVYQLTPQAEGTSLKFAISGLLRPDGAPSALVIPETDVTVTAGAEGPDFTAGGLLFGQ